MRAAFILGCIIVSAIVAYIGQPLIRLNADAIQIIITVLTVFAGFLFAVISILGDPDHLPPGSWRAAELYRENVHARIASHTTLFVVYLVAIAVLFAGVLIKDAPNTVIPITVKLWIERAYLFFGTVSFLLTFGLPVMLTKLQKARVDAEIQRRRQAAGLPEDDPNIH